MGLNRCAARNAKSVEQQKQITAREYLAAPEFLTVVSPVPSQRVQCFTVFRRSKVPAVIWHVRIRYQQSRVVQHAFTSNKCVHSCLCSPHCTYMYCVLEVVLRCLCKLLLPSLVVL